MMTESQRIVLDVLRGGGDYTFSEIGKILRIPVNRITPRIDELRKSGFCEFSRWRKCGVTAHNAKTWKAITPRIAA
jgi:DNA-binding MarR family transcriptional regulator